MRRGVLGLLCLLLVVLAGCGGLPDHGEVHRHELSGGDRAQQEVPYFDPPGPTDGASRSEIVKGFVVAMQAIPINPAAARSYLSDQAQSSWQPSHQTIVYQASTVKATSHGVRLRLADAHRLDSRGGWAPTPTHTRTLTLHLVRDKGQWRISDPVDALIIPDSTFRSEYQPFNLYFYDRGGRALVPDPVYIVRGEQTATNLVNGLLKGPDPRLAPVVRTAFPSQTSVDVSVVVTDGGIADVPLSSNVLKLSPEELRRAMIQLARTLRAVPGISRVRMTVGGSTVAMPDGRTSVDVDEGAEFAPSALGASRELLAIQRNRVVSVSGTTARPIAGDLGRPGYALRSLALDRSGARVAAVSQNGRAVFVSTKSPSAGVRRVFSRGHDLLRPEYDVYGRLWLVDATAHGAVVHVLHGRRDRVVRFPGISGADLTSFSVSPDGSRLVVGVHSRAAPEVRVASILRAPSGRVLRGLRPRAVPVTSYDPAHSLGPAVDVGWRNDTQIVVLTRERPGRSRLVFAMADGSPGGSSMTAPDAFDGDAVALVSSGHPQLPLLLVDSSGRLEGVDSAGKWTPTGIDHLVAATYAN